LGAGSFFYYTSKLDLFFNKIILGFAAGVMMALLYGGLSVLHLMHQMVVYYLLFDSDIRHDIGVLFLMLIA
jgi:hypothetical protein